jgi:hypothetical protein
LWAQRVLTEKGATAEQRVDRMYRSAFARPPTAAEVSQATQFIETQRAALGSRTTTRAPGRTWRTC